MKRAIAVVLGLSLAACLANSAPAEDDLNEEALKLAKKLTEEGAVTYNTANAKAMAAYYLEDAKIFLQGKDQDAVTDKEYVSRDEIEMFYADLFKDPKSIQAKNPVEYARLLAPDVLVIAGTFVPNEGSDKPLKVPFYQVRVKRADKWPIHRLRIFVL